MRRFTLFWALATALVASVSCGESPVGPPPVEPPPQPDRVSLRQGQDSVTSDTLTVEGAKQYGLVLFMTDGKMEVVTEKATWSSSNPAVASVTGGLVKAITSGNAIISASYLGFKPQLQLTVKPKPVPVDTVSTAGLSPLAKKVVLESDSIAGGRVVRYPTGITIGVEIPDSLLQFADTILSVWEASTGNKFVLAAPGTGQIVTELTNVGVKENTCGFGGPVEGKDGIVTKSRIVLRPNGCSQGQGGMYNFAHELGHALGLMSHVSPTKDGGTRDVMNASSTTLDTPVSGEAMRWYYFTATPNAVVSEG